MLLHLIGYGDGRDVTVGMARPLRPRAPPATPAAPLFPQAESALVDEMGVRFCAEKILEIAILRRHRSDVSSLGGLPWLPSFLVRCGAGLP